jgi:hypothetical protein
MGPDERRGRHTPMPGLDVSGGATLTSPTRARCGHEPGAGGSVGVVSAPASPALAPPARWPPNPPAAALRPRARPRVSTPARRWCRRPRRPRARSSARRGPPRRRSWGGRRRCAGRGPPGAGRATQPCRAAAPARPAGRRPRAVCPAPGTPRAPDDGVGREAAGGPPALPRLDARAPRGQRALATTPGTRGRPGTRRGAWRRARVGAARTGAGCPAGAVLLAWLQAVLRPQRRPGQRRRLGHRRAHPVPGGAAACAAAGVRRRERPPEAPAFAPSAAGWAKVTPRVRTQAARTLEALEQASAEALRALTRQDAPGWLAHAGYGVVSN